MEKMDCDIIRDLIPSYVDEICSKATKDCVEEHMRDCAECRQIIESCKNSILADSEAEQKGLDGLKGIKGLMKVQNLAMYLVMAIMILLGMGMFWQHSGTVLNFDYSILFAICLLVNVFTGTGYMGKKKPGLTEQILAVLLLLIDIYFVGIYLFLIKAIGEGAETVFGIKMYDIGPFWERQLGACFIVQIVIFLYYFLCAVKQDKNCSWMLCLNMMGIFMILQCESWLHTMDNAETLMARIQRGTVEIVVICIVGIAAGYVRRKIINKKLGI